MPKSPDIPAGSVKKLQLSSREEQLIQMAAEGLTDRAIAQSTNLSTATIKSYWIRLRQKVGAVNRTDAVVKSMVALEQPFGAPGNDSLQLWWRLMCRKAPWILVVLDEEGYLTFCSRPLFRGASDYMIGRHLLDMTAGRSAQILEKALDGIRAGKAHADCKANLRVSDTVIMEVSGRLARIERAGTFVGTLFFIEHFRRLAARKTDNQVLIVLDQEKS